MKNIFTITALTFSVCLISACGGDRVPQSGQGDTVKSTYPPTVDSSKFDKDTGRNVPGMHGKALKKDSVKK